MYAPGSQSQHWHRILGGLGHVSSRMRCGGTRGSLGNQFRERLRGEHVGLLHGGPAHGGRWRHLRICCSQPWQSWRAHDHRHTEQLWRIALSYGELDLVRSNLDIPSLM